MSSLLRHPDQFEALRQNRSLMLQAIEEGLRVETPIIYLERTVFAEMEIAGHIVCPGDVIFVTIGDANHDETVWQDPDRFNIFRDRRKILSFGGGSHVCIGQHLARVEMDVALKALLDRLPNLRLDPAAPELIIRGATIRKPSELRVLFG